MLRWFKKRKPKSDMSCTIDDSPTILEFGYEQLQETPVHIVCSKDIASILKSDIAKSRCNYMDEVPPFAKP